MINTDYDIGIIVENATVIELFIPLDGEFEFPEIGELLFIEGNLGYLHLAHLIPINDNESLLVLVLHPDKPEE